VSDAILTPRSGLEHIAGLGASEAPAGLVIEPRPAMALVAVIACKERIAMALQHAEIALGVALPTTPRCIAAGNLSWIWAGPGQWLAASERISGHVIERDLRRGFAGLASAIDQSDGRSVIRVSGAKAREALAKGVPIDLDQRTFSAGDTALTVAGHINVHLWQIDDTPTYEFAVFRSFAAAFCNWLLEASTEFGARTEGF
jgi:methylglutamate dehydrogenase subunit D